MSQLSTQPVIRCSRCGEQIVVESLVTAQPDPTSTQLITLLQELSKNALCPTCRGRLNYYARQGLGTAWKEGRA